MDVLTRLFQASVSILISSDGRKVTLGLKIYDCQYPQFE